MASRPKKSPYQVGKDVWVKAKITRVAPNPRLSDVTHVTVKMTNGNLETLWISPDDADTVRPDAPT